MKGLAWIAGLALLLASGCTSVHNVEYERAEEWIPQAQKDLQNKDVLLVTGQGASFEGNIVAINRDSVLLRLKSDASIWRGHLRDVGFIGRPANALPVVLGGLGGAVTGFVLGTAVGAESGTGLTSLGNMVGGAAVGVLIGVPAGAVIVGQVTAADQYQIAHRDNSERPAPTR